MDFPSKFCYDGRVVSNQRQPSILNWPAGRNKPSGFCKLDSLQSSLPFSVNTPKSDVIVNNEQADFAVS